MRIKICGGLDFLCGKLSRCCNVGSRYVVVLLVFVGVELSILWLLSVGGMVVV